MPQSLPAHLFSLFRLVAVLRNKLTWFRNVEDWLRG